MESVWRKAAKDTRREMLDTVRYQVLALIVAAIGGLIVAFATPANVSPQKQGIWGVIGALGSTIILIFGMLLWNLFRAPYRQRNELRSELLNVKDGKPTSDMEAIIQQLGKIGNHMEAVANVLVSQNPNRPKTNSRGIGEIIGITETGAGEAAFLVPADGASALGTVYPGSIQTFTGLHIDDSFYFSIPLVGNVVGMVTRVSNDIVEARFRADMTAPHKAITLTFSVDSQTVTSLFIPEGIVGFFGQLNRATIRKSSDVDLEYMGIEIRIAG